MLILVTGAAGRIGAHLTRRLVRSGHRVRALVLPNDPRIPVITAADVEHVYGRLEDMAAVAEAVRDVDAVYHLAAALTSRGHTDDEYFEVNLRGTFNLLMAVREQAPDIRRFVYASSDAVYHPGARGADYLPVDEAHPRLAASIYGASKLGAEELCLTFWRGFDVPVTILRFGPTADAVELTNPHSAFARWLFLRQAIKWLGSLPMGSLQLEQTRDALARLDDNSEQLFVLTDSNGNAETRLWGDARDIAEGCLRVLELPAATGEIFNLGGKAPFSTAELVPYIASRLGLPFVNVQVPSIASPWYVSSAKAGEILGYTPRYSVFDMVDEAIANATG